MPTTTPKTTVIFRRFLDGTKEPIALFILEPHAREGFYCMSYQHVGQHGAASPCLAHHNTIPAKVSEPDVAALKAELERIGYNLHVVTRTPRNASQKRRAALYPES